MDLIIIIIIISPVGSMGPTNCLLFGPLLAGDLQQIMM